MQKPPKTTIPDHFDPEGIEDPSDMIEEELTEDNGYGALVDNNGDEYPDFHENYEL